MSDGYHSHDYEPDLLNSVLFQLQVLSELNWVDLYCFVLLTFTQTSAGSAQAFVLESRSSAAAIILPGLTFHEKTDKYF